MRRQQQQTPRPPPSRRRPAWNSYLTDGAQYRLNEHQQLQRQLQQLSTAHFSSRSPSPASHQQRHQTSVTTPSRYNNNNYMNSSNGSSSARYTPNGVSIASASSTPVSAFAAGRERPGSGDSVRRRKAGTTVSFKLDHDHDEPKLDRSQKVNLQGELAVLERMLFELEAETATLNQEEEMNGLAQVNTYPHQQQMQRAGSPSNQEEVYTFDGHADDQYDEESDGDEEARRAVGEGYNDDVGEDGSGSDNDDEQGFEARGAPQTRVSRNEKLGDAAQDASSSSLEATQLSQVCYKSLSIGMQLAKKMDQLSRELDLERKMRMDHELKIEVLEQEVRSTRAKCNYLDVKYQSMLSQVDDMREALIATEEAVHRLTKQAVERTHRAKSSHRPPPSTPNTPKATKMLKQMNGFHEFEEEQTQRSRSAATPKRSPKADTSFARRERQQHRQQRQQQQQENEASFINSSESHQSGSH